MMADGVNIQLMKRLVFLTRYCKEELVSVTMIAMTRRRSGFNDDVSSHMPNDRGVGRAGSVRHSAGQAGLPI
jgi:hypothetical protein